MKVSFLACAEAELKDAVSYYNEQSSGLGFEFAAEVKRAVVRIVEHPKAWAKLSKRTRRCRVSRFPYGVIYQERDREILVIAVMHMSRRPGRWQERV